MVQSFRARAPIDSRSITPVLTSEYYCMCVHYIPSAATQIAVYSPYDTLASADIHVSLSYLMFDADRRANHPASQLDVNEIKINAISTDKRIYKRQ